MDCECPFYGKKEGRELDGRRESRKEHFREADRGGRRDRGEDGEVSEITQRKWCKDSL